MLLSDLQCWSLYTANNNNNKWNLFLVMALQYGTGTLMFNNSILKFSLKTWTAIDNNINRVSSVIHFSLEVLLFRVFPRDIP